VSKAFTRESDEHDAEEIPSVRPKLPPGAKNYITSEGANLLRENLNQLLEKRRAGAAMDSGIDAEARAEQRRIESAIRKLQSILDSVVIAGIPADQDRIAFGASVLLCHSNGEEEHYQIVGADESDPAQGRISWLSPLARALLNQKAGDKIRFRSPAGEEELKIVKVSYSV
jgi:transcription elongation factor GreB